LENGEKSQSDIQKHKQLLNQRKAIQQKLDNATQLLQDLRKAQHERLSANPPPHLALVRPPSSAEHELGECSQNCLNVVWMSMKVEMFKYLCFEIC